MFRCVEMVELDNYDYWSTTLFIELFQNPLRETPFIYEMESNNITMWQFKDCVATWTFEFNQFKNYMYLRHCEHTSPNFLVCNNKNFTLIEHHHKYYIFIALQANDDMGRAL